MNDFVVVEIKGLDIYIYIVDDNTNWYSGKDFNKSYFQNYYMLRYSRMVLLMSN